MKILLATHNPNKVIELLALLKDHPEIEVLTLTDLNITEEPEETESTFMGNAQLKAKWAADKSGMISLADDSGLEIDALDKEPGVMSARYLGKDTPYTIKNQIILDRLEKVSDRSARFVSVVAIASPQSSVSLISNTDIICCEGIMEGSIAYHPEGSNGFGYDPIFIPQGFNETYAQMTTETKNKVSHRGQAFRKAVIVLTQGEKP
ncbi:MAG: RdgB/HAM1 family non-canonical purine NTP pyrophosphatase [Erysipelotrichaceae bacterium]|nr:RdgB/HAM1 family non-canonical purine NTP pyrophosphatase [Erysipelotrichaceae bacterium]